MQVLLRNIHSGLFLDDKGRWTKHQRRARNFEKTRHAIEAAANLDPRQLELLLFFDDPLLKSPIPHDNLTCPKASARMRGVDSAK